MPLVRGNSIIIHTCIIVQIYIYIYIYILVLGRLIGISIGNRKNRVFFGIGIGII